MIISRKQLPRSAKARMWVPALAFFVFAGLSAAGGGFVAVPQLLPAGFAIGAGDAPDDDMSNS